MVFDWRVFLFSLRIIHTTPLENQKVRTCGTRDLDLFMSTELRMLGILSWQHKTKLSGLANFQVLLQNYGYRKLPFR
ncbi:hypothetical protein RvY_00360 [Ramazzottius varieornatus]|uniref:Uncharacterized protein n=1 Tax=Ramazzottius varieornatus TaxID=947166 RepID=A0A1D1UG63_RAMVA|nr:hypothetical protein RvY_00360 [Ramazzottius varieornatus]